MSRNINSNVESIILHTPSEFIVDSTGYIADKNEEKMTDSNERPRYISVRFKTIPVAGNKWYYSNDIMAARNPVGPGDRISAAEVVVPPREPFPSIKSNLRSARLRMMTMTTTGMLQFRDSPLGVGFQDSRGDISSLCVSWHHNKPKILEEKDRSGFRKSTDLVSLLLLAKLNFKPLRFHVSS